MKDRENLKWYKGILGTQSLIQQIFIDHIIHPRYCARC